MTNIQIGSQVKVTFGRIGQEALVFTSEVMDIVDNSREQGVWVDHPECRGEDMLYVSLVNPHINQVEAVEVATVEREASKEIDMKEAKKALQKAFKWVDEDIKVSVKIYDCFEDNTNWGGTTQQSYDIEIQWAFDGEEYTDCLVTDTYYSTLQDDEVSLKQATTRAKSVLRTVKGWFDRDDQVTVVDGIEVYHQ